MEHLKPITMNKSEYMTEKLEDLIEKGTVIKYQKEGSSLINYSIKGTRIRWIEEDEELIESQRLAILEKKEELDEILKDVFPNWLMTLIPARVYNNQDKRRFNFLRWKFTELYHHAHRFGAVVKNGPKCKNCGSTNTQRRGTRHSCGGLESWIDCYDCETSEYTGERF